MKTRLYIFEASMRHSVLIGVMTLLSAFSSASATPEYMCDRAALAASRSTTVPIEVLRAITRTETGLRRLGELHPWPWTVNMEGEGHWFDTETEAQAFVFKHFKRGVRSFDVGCFQINYRWHSQAFQSIEEMFDPSANADYAAQLLSKLYAEFGSWTSAAGAYHSRTPKHARNYQVRFKRVQAELPAMHRAVRETNALPIVRGPSTSVQRGSLVPLTLNSRGAVLPNGDAING